MTTDNPHYGELPDGQMLEGEVVGFFVVGDHTNPKYAHKHTFEVLVDSCDGLRIGDKALVWIVDRDG